MLGNRPRVTGQFADGRNVDNLLGIGVERKALGDLPDEDLSILGSGSDDVVVEGVPACLSASVQEPRARGTIPIGIEDSSGVSTKQRDLVRHLSSLFQGDDGERAATRRVPIDGEEFGVGLVIPLISAPAS